MIFSAVSILRSVFGQNTAAMSDHARRWSRAFRDDPSLARDLIAQGGLLVTQPVQMTGGFPEPLPLDPYRLAYEAGRRDLAIQLLAAGGVSISELNSMMKEQTYDD